jgi:hypothetical protein
MYNEQEQTNHTNMIKFLLSKPFWWTLVLAFVGYCCVTGKLSAQDNEPQVPTIQMKGLPDSILWNLDQDAKDELSDHEYNIPDTWDVWTRPDSITAHLAYVKVGDLKSGGDKRLGVLIANAKKMGLVPCPAWVPVQMYLLVEYKDRAVWIPLNETTSGEIPRIGCGKSLAHTGSCIRTMFFSGDPANLVDQDVLIFMKK